MFKRRSNGRPLKSANWCVAIVGMNGTGKSVFGKKLAVRLGLNRQDADSLFIAQYGDIQAYIKQHGIEAYKQLEETLILEVIKPGNLIILSGGSIESNQVRAALQKMANVIWIQAGKRKVIANLKKAKKSRYEFMHQPPEELAMQLLKKRNPLYEEVATIKLYEQVPYKHYLAICVAELGKLSG